jgi:hypothetical protein
MHSGPFYSSLSLHLVWFEGDVYWGRVETVDFDNNSHGPHRPHGCRAAQFAPTLHGEFNDIFGLAVGYTGVDILMWYMETLTALPMDPMDAMAVASLRFAA